MRKSSHDGQFGFFSCQITTLSYDMLQVGNKKQSDQSNGYITCSIILNI